MRGIHRAAHIPKKIFSALPGFRKERSQVTEFSQEALNAEDLIQYEKARSKRKKDLPKDDPSKAV